MIDIVPLVQRHLNWLEALNSSEDLKSGELILRCTNCVVTWP